MTDFYWVKDTLLYHIVCFLWKRELILSQICDVDFSLVNYTIKCNTLGK